MADSEHTPLLPENRTDLEALIEAAIARLDLMDPDTDLEDAGDDEPWLGAYEQVAFDVGTHWYNSAVEDREEDHDAEEADERISFGCYAGPCSPIASMVLP